MQSTSNTFLISRYHIAQNYSLVNCTLVYLQCVYSLERYGGNNTLAICYFDMF